MSHKTKIGWITLLDAIQVYLLSEGFEMGSTHHDIPYFKKKSENDVAFFIAPLKPGLVDYLKEWREDTNDYKAPAILLTESEQSYPSRLNPDMDSGDKEKFFGNPEYGDFFQAIFRGEIIKIFESDYNASVKKNSGDKEKDDIHCGSFNDTCVFSNIVPVFSEKFPENLIENCINPLFPQNSRKEQDASINFVRDQMGELREAFYKTFVNYYDYPDTELSKIFTSRDKSAKRLNNIQDVKQCIEDCDIIYKALTTDKSENVLTHRKDKDFIKAPVSFFLYDFAQKLKDLKKWMGKKSNTNPVRFLLIDNKKEKFIKEDSQSSEPSGRLCELLLNEKHGLPEELRSVFQIDMPEFGTFKYGDGKKEVFYHPSGSNIPENDRVFNSKKFFDPKTNDENDDQNYRHKIYDKIKNSHFVLLDFFLDSNDIWLAFDFIQEINKIKKEKNDNFTAWFFITSAVHDSVSKYQQSGLLAEFYETAIVNSGDDPLNEKRTIIFLYKLITFIHSRLVNFTMYQEEIEQLYQETTCSRWLKKEGCTEKECLQHKETCISRYLTEFDTLWSIFFPEKEANLRKNVIQRIQDTINKFLNLPQADWRMVQFQIDYINANLKGFRYNEKKKSEFCCNYVIDSIKSSSEKF